MKKRLTHSGNYCDSVAMCDRESSLCSARGCRNKRIWEKLCAYEDTGLSPEEVTALQRRLAGTDREESGLLEDD